MSGYVLAQSADDDLVAIWAYVFHFEQSDRRADRAIRHLFNTFEKLAAFPRFGTPRPKYGPGVLAFPAERWVVYFRRSEDGIEIIRVTGEQEDVLPER